MKLILSFVLLFVSFSLPANGGTGETTPTASALTPAEAEANAGTAWYNAIEAARARYDAKRIVDVSGLRDSLRNSLSAVVKDETAEGMVRDYLEFIRSRYPEMLGEEAAGFANSPSEPTRIIAEGMRLSAELVKRPIEMAFTALDGQQIDLKNLRGKVVLLDFWATTCTPCVAEMPNVAAVYAKYRDQGFAVIGISLDREKDRSALIKFMQTNDMTWPQHFDGAGWKNTLAVRYAVSSIPTTFLLDQEGRLTSTHARGPELEAMVQRLLKR